MGAAFAFVGMLLLSLLVAVLAAMQLADFFRSTEEFAVVLLVLPAFACVIMLVFAWAYVEVREPGAFHRVAIFLALIAAGLIEIIKRSPGAPEGPIMLELLVPALIAILIQWGLVRRRWLRMHGEDDLSRWPWVTTVVAWFGIFNPFGLEAVAVALRQSASDRLHDPMALLPLAATAALVAMALIECYIRAWMLRRRRGAAA